MTVMSIEHSPCSLTIKPTSTQVLIHNNNYNNYYYLKKSSISTLMDQTDS